MSTPAIIRWTRQADGSYSKEGTLPPTSQTLGSLRSTWRPQEFTGSRNRPKPKQIEKPTRKRRRDAKYGSHSERQRAYHARNSPYQLPQPIKDYLGTRVIGTGVAVKRVLEPV
jgi:hypothetical protein